MPKIPAGPAFELPPDWVCEVASPSTARLDRSRKMDIYARVAIPHMWIVDPIPKILESYQLDGGRWLRLASHAGDACVRAVPFDAIELDLGGWWTEPDPARPEPSDPA